jgi:hypothetical protein
MDQLVKVSYESTSDLTVARRWLKELNSFSTIACDLETSTRYSDEDRVELLATSLDESLPKQVRRAAKAKLHSSALSHPMHTVLTHFQVAWNEEEAKVFILDSVEITELILNFIVTTKVKQIWHNYSFDGKHIYFYTLRHPIDFEDSQILAKTLANHVDIQHATTGLKELAGCAYGAWSVSDELFHFDNLNDPKLLLYAATDPCATMWIWNVMQHNLKESQ